MQVRRRTGATAGLLLIVLGAWGALIPFVGPYFDYGFDRNDTWIWHTSRLWMNVLPGAAAVLAGLVLIGLAGRFSLVMGAWIASAAGGWFVVAPALSMLWNHNASLAGVPLGDAHRQALEYLGFYYGLGALIMFLGAMELGRLSTTVVGVPVMEAAPVEASAVGEEETAAEATGAPRRSRWHRRHRPGPPITAA
jgi:hypothetical protein